MLILLRKLTNTLPLLSSNHSSRPTSNTFMVHLLDFQANSHAIARYLFTKGQEQVYLFNFMT